MAEDYTPPNPQLDEEGLRRQNRSRAGEWVWFGVLSFILLLVTVAGFSMAAAVSPAFCSTCHRSSTDHLAASAHASVECDSCHRDSGALALLENRLWVAGMVIASPVRAVFPSGAQAAVDRERCIECHDQQMSVTAVKNGIQMNHRGLVKANWSCQRCHKDVAHGQGGQVVASYTMGTCLGCHSTGPENLNSCNICHPQDTNPSAYRVVNTPWSVTHGSNWQQMHGMGDLASCKACHAKDYCVGCHEMELPHPQNFMRTHGDEMARVGEDACYTCHQKESCNSCHGGIEMPHPESFMQDHPTLVEEEGSESCARCHDEISCTDCHERHVHPGVDPDLRDALEANPVNVR